MEYIIVTAEYPSSTQTLARLVQEKIGEGYEPIGGVTVWKDSLKGRCFSQAMVKLDEPPIVQIDSPTHINPNTGKPYEDGVGW